EIGCDQGYYHPRGAIAREAVFRATAGSAVSGVAGVFEGAGCCAEESIVAEGMFGWSIRLLIYFFYEKIYNVASQTIQTKGKRINLACKRTTDQGIISVKSPKIRTL